MVLATETFKSYLITALVSAEQLRTLHNCNFRGSAPHHHIPPRFSARISGGEKTDLQSKSHWGTYDEQTNRIPFPELQHW